MLDRDLCCYCRQPFTDEEWDTRHTDACGEAVHEECCDICHGDDTDHRSGHVIWRDAQEVATTWGSHTAVERERKAIEGLLNLVVEDWTADAPIAKQPWGNALEVWQAIDQGRAVLSASRRWDQQLIDQQQAPDSERPS